MARLLDKLNQVSPKLCRALARSDDGLKPISHRRLALRCGFSKDLIMRFSRLNRWDTIPMGLAERYVIGCGLSFIALRETAGEKMRRMKFMKHLDGHQRRMYDRLLPKLGDADGQPAAPVGVASR